MRWAPGVVVLAACWGQPPPANRPAAPAAVPARRAAPALAEPPDPEPPHGRMVVSAAPCGGLWPLIFFDENSAEIAPRSATTLDDAATGLRCYLEPPSGLTIEVPLIGHAAPGEARPGPLSIERANAVAKALVARGVPPDVLVISGEGETKPIGDPTTENGRKINRAVSIYPIVHGSD